MGFSAFSSATSPVNETMPKAGITPIVSKTRVSSFDGLLRLISTMLIKQDSATSGRLLAHHLDWGKAGGFPSSQSRLSGAYTSINQFTFTSARYD